MSKKISIGTIDKMVADFMKKDKYYTVTWNDYDITINTAIGLKELVSITEGIIDSCFSTDGGTYTPEVFDFAMRSCIVGTMSNVKLPDDMEKRFNILFRTDLYDTVCKNISDNDYYISYIKECAMSAIHERISTNAMNLRDEVEQLSVRLGDVINNVSNMFEGIGNEDLKSILGAIGDGGIDENKLMTAYINSKKGDDVIVD